MKSEYKPGPVLGPEETASGTRRFTPPRRTRIGSNEYKSGQKVGDVETDILSPTRFNPKLPKG